MGGAPYTRNDGYGGEQGAAFILGEAGYFILDGPSGASSGAHAANAHGPDGVAFNTATQDLIIYDEKDYLAVDTEGFYRLRKLATASALVTGLNTRWLDKLLAKIAAQPDFPARALIIARLKTMQTALAAGSRVWPAQTRVALVRWRGGVVAIGDELRKKNVQFVDLITDPAILNARRDKAKGWSELMQALGRIRRQIDLYEGEHRLNHIALNRKEFSSSRAIIESSAGLAGRATHAAMRIEFPPLAIWAEPRFAIQETERTIGLGNFPLAVAEMQIAGLRTVLAIRKFQLWKERVHSSREPMEYLIAGSAATLIGVAIMAWAAAGLVVGAQGATVTASAAEMTESSYKMKQMVRIATEWEQKIRIEVHLEQIEQEFDAVETTLRKLAR